MKANTNIHLKDRKSLLLGNFRGADFSSSVLQMRGDRAADLRNFTKDFGVVKKRNGWRELLRIELDGAPQRINGIFEFEIKGKKEVLVYAGTRFYRLEKSEDGYSYTDITFSSTYERAKCNGELLRDQRCQHFRSGNRVYFVGCGDYLVYGSWNGGESYELRRVYDNEDTYVPTTTVSIDSDGIADTNRATLDDVNCLCSKRKNQLLGTGSYYEKTFTLDSSIDEGSEVEVLIETLTTVYQGSKNSGDGTYGKEIGNAPITYRYKNNDPEDPNRLYFVDAECPGYNIYPMIANDYIKPDTSSYNNKINDRAFGKIYLRTFSPTVSGRDNIFVTFQHKNEEYEKRITQCSFGTLFGAEGNTDRLFLSGNEDLKNYDFYSYEDDFTYFPDLNSAVVGDASSAVMGYSRASDGTLLIFKDSADHGASLFYRTGTYLESRDADGNVDTLRGIFPTKAATIGEDLISRYAAANFLGDNVILSKNGVFGIALSSGAATVERYTRERSYTVNGRLTKHEGLSEAVATVFQNKYYLAVDGVCYVADFASKYTSEIDPEGSYSYEWWFWDNMPVRCWAVGADRLTFGTDDGRICAFDNEYTDRTYYKTATGALGIDVSQNKVICSERLGISLNESDELELLTDGVFALAVPGAVCTDGRFYTDAASILALCPGDEVCVDIDAEASYYIGEIDPWSASFTFLDEDGNAIAPEGETIDVYLPLKGLKLYATDVSPSAFSLKRYREGQPLTLAKMPDHPLPTTPIARFTLYKNVVAEWYTPVLDLGSSMHAKTLLKLSFAAEPSEKGRLSFGYQTRLGDRLIAAKGMRTFSFEDFSFEDFSFDTGFATSHTVRCNERNFNYIVFRFFSDTDTVCSIDSLTIVYKINKANKGVR